MIATLADKGRRLKHRILILSADHDFEQLVTKNVKILFPKMGKIQEYIKDETFLEKKFQGLSKNQILEFMILNGGKHDDNTPSIEGLGPKTIINLLKANRSIKEMLANDKLYIFNKKGKKVEASKKLYQKIKSVKAQETINLNYELIKLKKDLPVDYNHKEKSINWKSIEEIFSKLEFKSFIKGILDFKRTFDVNFLW